MRGECDEAARPVRCGFFVDSVFLQMFLWKPFEVLAPVLVEYSSTVPGRVEVGSSRRNVFKARGLRWAGLKQSTDKLLSAVIDV